MFRFYASFPDVEEPNISFLAWLRELDQERWDLQQDLRNLSGLTLYFSYRSRTGNGKVPLYWAAQDRLRRTPVLRIG